MITKIIVSSVIKLVLVNNDVKPLVMTLTRFKALLPRVTGVCVIRAVPFTVMQCRYSNITVNVHTGAMCLLLICCATLRQFYGKNNELIRLPKSIKQQS